MARKYRLEELAGAATCETRLPSVGPRRPHVFPIPTTFRYVHVQQLSFPTFLTSSSHSFTTMADETSQRQSEDQRPPSPPLNSAYANRHGDRAYMAIYPGTRLSRSLSHRNRRIMSKSILLVRWIDSMFLTRSHSSGHQTREQLPLLDPLGLSLSLPAAPRVPKIHWILSSGQIAARGQRTLGGPNKDVVSTPKTRSTVQMISIMGNTSMIRL